MLTHSRDASAGELSGLVIVSASPAEKKFVRNIHLGTQGHVNEERLDSVGGIAIDCRRPFDGHYLKEKLARSDKQRAWNVAALKANAMKIHVAHNIEKRPLVLVHGGSGSNRSPASLFAYLLLYTDVPCLTKAATLLRTIGVKGSHHTNTFRFELQAICREVGKC